jgi:DNA repair protein RecO (recombination protein O)
MYQTTKVLILRYALYKEKNRILTVLTESGEKLTVTANSSGAFTEPFTCSELTMRESRGRWNVQEGRTIAEFLGLRQELERFELAAYISKVLESLADSDVPDPALFRLGVRALNSLASQNPSELAAFKAAFEERSAALSGFSVAELRGLINNE